MLVLGGGKDAETLIGRLSAMKDWQVADRSEPGDSFEVVVLTGTVELDAAWLGTFKEEHQESLIMCSRSLTEEVEVWSRIDAHVDDLFDSPNELLERLPFITKRLSVRDARRQQFEAIFDNAVDAIIIINRSGQITRFNRAAEATFGYATQEVRGQNVSILMPMSYARNHDRYMNNYLRTGVRKVMGLGREVEGQRKNGEIFPMELALSEFRSEGELFFAGFVRDITERRKLEHEILRTSEHERRRVGQDLHDGLGQMLTGISLIAGNLARQLTMQDHDLADDMSEVVELMRDADRMSRNIARGLVPVELDGEGLAAAIEGLCANARKFFSVECHFSEEGKPNIRDSGAVSNLYRIAQECISNAVKHGRATRIDVALRTEGNDLVLEVKDNGIGFPETLSEDRGMGVDIMGYRARVINARLTIERRDEGGTIITCVLSSPDP